MARSEVSYTYEADTAFRTPGSAAVTANGNFGEFALDKLVNAREGDQKNKLGAEGYAIVIAVENAVTAAGDETYQFDVVVGPAGLSTSVLAGATSVVGAGQYVIMVDAHTIEKLSADRESLGLNVTVGGASPSITFSAWVAYANNHG